MSTSTGIEKRIILAFESLLNENDIENALYQICSAIDATAKKRYPKKKAGERIGRFLHDNQDIIYSFSTQDRVLLQNGGKVIWCNEEMQQIIYKYIRCEQFHTGEYDKTKIYIGGDFGIGNFYIEGHSPDIEFVEGKYIISFATVFSLIFSVICAIENNGLNLGNLEINIFKEKIKIHEFLGNKKKFIEWYKLLFP